MSHGYCPYTTVAAVKAADAILGPNRVWHGNAGQRSWLEAFYKPISTELPKIPEIASNATAVAAEHVAFLEKHGWKADLTECAPGKFLVAGVLDLLVRWKEPGTQAPLTIDGKKYAGARLEGGVTYWQTEGGPAACIATQSTDRVWLRVAESAPTQLELARVARELLAGPKTQTRYDDLYFPMVDLAARETLDWLVGLATVSEDGRGWEIEEAIQKVTLKMNHEGARARAVDEMRVGPTSIRIPQPFVIDKPFLVVFERPGLAQPLFTAYVTEDAWKDPGGLGI